MNGSGFYYDKIKNNIEEQRSNNASPTVPALLFEQATISTGTTTYNVSSTEFLGEGDGVSRGYFENDEATGQVGIKFDFGSGYGDQIDIKAGEKFDLGRFNGLIKVIQIVYDATETDYRLLAM